MSLHRNTLYYGDNLQIMRALPAESVDLIYLDPPFNSKANYNVFFGEGKDKAQNEAFRDTWSWRPEHKTLYNDLIANEEGFQTEATIKTLQGLYQILGSCGMLSYLLYMQVRLVEMRRLLKPTGSLYLHCDPTASHFLKLVLDSVFGKSSFKNEIVWDYKKISNAATQKFSRGHDIVLFYWKSSKATFHPQFEEVSPRKLQLMKSGYNTKKQDGKRLLYIYDLEIVEEKIKSGGLNLGDFSKIIQVNTDRGAPMRDIFRIDFLNSQAAENLGYPTQKPLALLERIIKASSNEGDIVLDPFCGCGTTLDAAESLKRRWIGIDISYLSVDTIKSRLSDRYKDRILDTFDIKGTPKDLGGAEKLLQNTLAKAYSFEPATLEEAIALAEREGKPGEKYGKNAGRFEFQRWACSLIDASPNDREIGDGGVDGKLRWVERPKVGEPREIFGAVQVKSSLRVTPNDVRALKGLLTNGEEYITGILISLYKSHTEEIQQICQSFAEPEWQHYTGHRYPKLQVWSIEEHFTGIQPHLPTALRPYKRAELDKMKVKQVAY